MQCLLVVRVGEKVNFEKNCVEQAFHFGKNALNPQYTDQRISCGFTLSHVRIWTIRQRLCIFQLASMHIL